MKKYDYILNNVSLPQYNSFTPSDAEEFVENLIIECNNIVSQIINFENNKSWENSFEPLSMKCEKLSRVWSTVHHLSGVIDSPEWRKIINDKTATVTEFWTELSQNSELAKITEELAKDDSVNQYSNRMKVIENALRDFKLGGATLDAKEKKIFVGYEKKLAILSQKFSENILDSTKASFIHLNDDDNLTNRLSGLPEYVRNQAKKTAEKQKLGGVVLTLLAPCLYPTLRYSNDRSLRFSLYSLHSRKASEIAEEGSQFDNGSVMAEIIKNKYKKAKLLGFKSPAEMSLASKMADSPEQVIKFLSDLAKAARPFAVKDLENLKKFASAKLDINKIEPWDFEFVSEKLRKQEFNYSDDELREYFPIKKVLQGLFDITKKLFKCKIDNLNNRDNKIVWHEDVLLFEISKNNALVGHLFMDLFARETKRSGAWMDDSRGRYVTENKSQNPIALINCNFSPPDDSGNCFLTHDEVLTLFHEFGHSLHHLMTKIDEIDISGINGVEWDAVELPSQFMENFCWEYKNLKALTSHRESGLPIPHELFEKVYKAKNFQSGLQMLRQIEFSLFDIRIHHELPNITNHTNEKIISKIYMVLEKIRDEVSLIVPPSFQRFPQSFSHIFSGGYSAGYYSYKWAEVLSADCYSVFENKSDKEQAILGQKFFEQILSKGGSRPAIKSFMGFMNRKPSSDALMKHSGLINTN
ncbi:MAG: hypothetical protein CBD16_02945 [Betaproteobacteria bacterium TMED156]|nr:MAG: hypothetical protein CBD16_02945 [Betaproteobacteria bacterium TMED156]